MKHAKSIVVSALLVSAVAATSVFAGNSMGMTAKMGSGKNSPFSNTGVIQMLKDKGITAPTVEEAKAFETKMKALQKAEKSLSVEAKAQLETLRKSFKKQEREFYRTQGVVLPTEDEIAKMESIHELLRSSTGSGSKGPMGGPGMGRGSEGRDGGGKGHGGMMGGGEGMDRDTEGSEDSQGRPGMMNGSGSNMGPRGGMMNQGNQGQGQGQGRGRDGMKNKRTQTPPVAAPTTPAAPVAPATN